MDVLRQIAWLSSMALAFVGAVLVGYSLLAEATRSPWAPLESRSEWIATITTLLAVLITALVAYMPENKTPVKEMSKTVVAPAVVALSLLLAGRSWRTKRPMSAMLINGLSILALGGGLLRMIPAQNI